MQTGSWSFEEGRRQVVWALERIAVWRDLLPEAARLLLPLAEAENEDFSNNATGVFVSLFSLGYGGVAPTEAAPEKRLPILREALGAASARRREVAILACEKALEANHFSRTVGAEYQGLRRPPQLWMPNTWDEVFERLSCGLDARWSASDAFQPRNATERLRL